MNEAAAKINEATAKEQRFDKHLGINNAIDNIDSVIEHAKNTIARINGHEISEEALKPVHISPSLLDVLSGGESEIRGKIDELHSLLNEIESLIF